MTTYLAEIELRIDATSREEAARLADALATILRTIRPDVTAQCHSMPVTEEEEYTLHLAPVTDYPTTQPTA